MIDENTERRAPVQRNLKHNKPAGTIEWSEHLEVYAKYAAKHGTSQSADRIAERSGFCYGELVFFLGYEPKTWKPNTR